MRKIIILVFCLCLFAASECAAQSINTIKLKDGTVLSGRVIKMDNGIFTIDTKDLGRIEVPEEKIKDITSATDGRENAVDYKPNIPPQKLENAKNELMNDPQVISGVQELMQDDEVVQILSDPELINAVMNMDQESLQDNPKFQKLLANPIMQQLIQQKTGSIIKQNQ